MRLDQQEIDRVVVHALQEDIGHGDLTTNSVIEEGATTTMTMVSRQAMVVCGVRCVERVYRLLEPRIQIKLHVKDGQKVRANTRLITLRGNARKILSGERVALNLIQRLSGVATLTASYVKKVAGTGAVILDTRKTTPGLRMLEKYAVAMGGGTNHRMRLDDGILIKDNHLAVCGSIGEAVKRARKYAPKKMPVQVEVDTLTQLNEALAAGATRILLDNMDLPTLRKAVKKVGGKIPLEASGGITLENVRNVAMTGVDFISVGAITHSAPSADIGLDIT